MIIKNITISVFLTLILANCSGIDLPPVALPKPSDDSLVRKSKSSQYRVPQIFVSNPTGYCKMSFIGQNGRSRSTEINKLIGRSFGVGNYSRIFDFYPVPDRYYTVVAKFDRIDGKASSGNIDITFFYEEGSEKFVIEPETYPNFCDERLRRKY